jgi:hypothetical protein
MIYFGACLTAGIRLARETHVNHRVIPTSNAINESGDLAHEIYNRVIRKVPERNYSEIDLAEEGGRGTESQI